MCFHFQIGLLDHERHAVALRGKLGDVFQHALQGFTLSGLIFPGPDGQVHTKAKPPLIVPIGYWRQSFIIHRHIVHTDRQIRTPAELGQHVTMALLFNTFVNCSDCGVVNRSLFEQVLQCRVDVFWFDGRWRGKFFINRSIHQLIQHASRGVLPFLQRDQFLVDVA